MTNEELKEWVLAIWIGDACKCSKPHICVAHHKILAIVATVQEKERKATWAKARAVVPEVGVTFPNGYEEWIDAHTYKAMVISALENAANRDEGKQ